MKHISEQYKQQLDELAEHLRRPRNVGQMALFKVVELPFNRQPLDHDTFIDGLTAQVYQFPQIEASDDAA